MWIGTFGGGLNRFKNGKFTVYDKIRGLSDDFVLSITEDDRGNLWVGTKDGLNRFKNGSFKTFTTRDGLSGNMIMDTYVDADGVLWIATNGGGLNRLKNGRITAFKSGIGEFSNNVIYRILEDAGSNLWMSSNQGIFSVSRRSLNRYAEGKRDTLFPYHFKEEDGLKTSVCSGGFQPAGWKTGNGKIWFPTHKGIAMIDLSRVTFRVDKLPEVIEPETTRSPVPSVSYMVVVREQPVVIDKVLVDGDVIDMQKDYIFSPDAESIQFNFTLLNYTAPDKIVFKYRLWGLDDRWGEIVDGNKVVYRNVPTGRYTFRVLARTSQGDWVYRGDSFSFFVDQRFYQSFWFYFIITIVVVTAVVAIPRLLEKRTNEKEVDTEKYKSSSLSDRRSEAYLRKLLHLMDTEKPYLDPNLSLQTMSDKVGCTKENLSQVINEQTDLNFKNFLNKYRVEEAKKKLADPKENQYVLMKIAYDVGFNSKSVFNAAFKKFTGISPSQYKKQVQVI
ncbi:MAG: helix-turn-helix domain-containing protein [bacterium]|nr:helix-turn-helix domain-containing protein [bacterium]